MDKEEIIQKYKKRLENELGSAVKPVSSKEYKQFRKETLPRRLSFYEKLCNIRESGNNVSLK